jgi:hypothetical protein
MMEGPSGRDEEKTDMFGRKKDGRFGHLREVGVQGFVDAVEQEEKGVWVVVHLYEPVGLSFLFLISIRLCCSLR